MDKQTKPSQAVIAAEEHLASGRCEPLADLLPVEFREFVSSRCGSRGISTGTLTLPPQAELPYHRHVFSEAVTVLEGELDVMVQGSCYQLKPLDCVHFPAGTPHRIRNGDKRMRGIAHYAFASESPTWEIVGDTFKTDLALASTEPRAHVSRLGSTRSYDLGDGTRFFDLFAGRFGSVGICGGYAEFPAGTSLPCHVHRYDESITIITGQATCRVAGRSYVLSGYDTAFVPQGRPHRFLNESKSKMAMIWVYAGDEPERTLVSRACCDGTGSVSTNERRRC